MNKFLLVLICLYICLSMKSQVVTTIEMKEKGTLINLLTNREIEKTEKIVILGNALTTNDFSVLKKMLVMHELQEIDLTNTYTASIPEYAFEKCQNLKKIKLPRYLLQIGRLAFRDCSNLSNIEFPTSLQTIDVGAFWGCSSFTSIKLNRQLQKIQSQAFLYCENLKEIHCIGTKPPLCYHDSFGGLHEKCILYVPIESKKTYTYSDGWLYFENMIEEKVEAPCLLDVNLYNGRFVLQLYPSYEGEGGAVAQWIYPGIDSILEFEKGETILFQIEPQTDYFTNKYIEKILLDGIDITSQLTGSYSNMLYITVNKDSQLDIYVKEKTSTSNEIKINGNMKVFTTSDYIVVNNVKIGERIDIYDLSGILIYTEITNDNNCNIKIPNNQIYIIRIGNKTFKIKK